LKSSVQIFGKRVLLRPVQLADFPQWSEVRTRNANWLTKWEPMRTGTSNPDSDKNAFALRCSARDRDWQFGSSFGFGVFIEGSFAGEINVNSVQRGPFQSAQVGYWIDERFAGQGYIPESLVSVLRYSFEVQNLHRIEVSIVPRNTASIRVVEKLQLRNEGLAERYLEINGTWEDHVRYAITSEEWVVRQKALEAQWLE